MPRDVRLSEHGLISGNEDTRPDAQSRFNSCRNRPREVGVGKQDLISGNEDTRPVSFRFSVLFA